jgi:THO complex subunit 1
MLIAYVFPLDDPSGQNKTGKTNTTNVTLYEMPPLEKETKVDLAKVVGDATADKKDGDAEMTPVEPEKAKETPQPKVDMTFYGTFWGLQQFFVEPSLLKPRFVEFKSSLDTILDAFDKQPLSSLDALSAQSKDYFPKYLTSSKLMELQLRDPALRRHILLQCLVLFQSLTPAYCQKLGLTLSVRQTEMIEALRTRVNAVLEQTPADADAKTFAKQVAVIIAENERTWTKWKDEEKCPKMQLAPADISKKVTVAKVDTNVKKDSKDSAAEGLPVDMIPGMLEDTYTIAKTKTGKLVMGSAELGRLWALPPNMEVAAEPGRNFSPVFTEFLEQMMSEETSGDDKFGEDARLKNDPVYVWRLLRLMQFNDFAMFLKASLGLKDFCKWMVDERNNVGQDKEEGHDGAKEGAKEKDEAAAEENGTAKEESENESAKKRKRDDDASEETAKKEKMAT